MLNLPPYKATKHWECGDCGKIIEPGDRFDIQDGNFICSGCFEKSDGDTNEKGLL